MKAKIMITIALVTLLISGALKAQEYTINIQNPEEGVITLEGFSGDLTIEGYSGNDVIFSSHDAEPFEVPERAEGLQPIYSGGTDNTGLGLEIYQNDNQIEATCLLPFTNYADYNIKVPEDMSIKIQSRCEYSSNIFIRKMKNEIEIQTCHDINLEDVSGPLVLSTISGDINITFGTINIDKPFSISSVSGDVDIMLPENTGVNLEMQSISGTMYSDFDFTNLEKDMKRIGGNKLVYQLNGGGNKFNIMSVSGNIYLRKGQ